MVTFDDDQMTAVVINDKLARRVLQSDCLLVEHGSKLLQRQNPEMGKKERNQASEEERFSDGEDYVGRKEVGRG